MYRIIHSTLIQKILSEVYDLVCQIRDDPVWYGDFVFMSFCIGSLIERAITSSKTSEGLRIRYEAFLQQEEKEA